LLTITNKTNNDRSQYWELTEKNSSVYERLFPRPKNAEMSDRSFGHISGAELSHWTPKYLTWLHYFNNGSAISFTNVVIGLCMVKYGMWISPQSHTGKLKLLLTQ
jgi:hypothetical protein